MRTKRQPARQSIWENRFGYLPAALSVGIGLLLAGLAVLSGLLLLSDLSEWISALLLGLLLFCSGYSMGRFAGFHRRRKGWLTGLCCGPFTILKKIPVRLHSGTRCRRESLQLLLRWFWKAAGPLLRCVRMSIAARMCGIRDSPWRWH